MPNFGLFPPVPTGFIAWWEQANPVMARPSGRCSHCSHCSHHFFIYTVQTADQDHTFVEVGIFVGQGGESHSDEWRVLAYRGPSYAQTQGQDRQPGRGQFKST